MNSPLEQDFHGFDFASETKIVKSETNSGLPILEEQIEATKSLVCVSEDLPQCEVCGQQFLTKKELRAHITVHLGQPRIILKRCTNLQSVKKKDTYCLTQERKGSLKLTLKKQNHSDFAVINRDLDIDKDSEHNIEEVAGDDERNDRTDVEKKSEDTNEKQHTFENVMVNEDDDYHEDQYDNDDENYLDDNERPSAEINEGDSGVGSDMANPLEKEDQNVDDNQNSDQYETEEAEKTPPSADDCEEPEDPELEATCRETIENLKKLGEQSNSRKIRDEEDMSPRHGNKSSNETSELDVLSETHTALSLLAKNSALEICSPRERRTNKEDHRNSVTWTSVSENLASKDTSEVHDDVTQHDDLNDDNADSTGSILQKFLNEHHRKDNNDSHPVSIETEYVSLEKLAETVNTCRVCNEKFHDITMLDEHRSQAGHYQCNIPDCSNLVFTSIMEVSIHKSQVHGASLSPSISITPAQMTRSSPHLSEGSPRRSINSNSPHLSNNSPHNNNTETMNSHQLNRTSPHNSSPHQNHSPTFNSTTLQQQQIIPPVNFDQLPAPVQQLAQQVQRMPLPQPQMPPSLPPGANTMIPGPNYFVQPTGRPPPMYRMPGPGPGIQYPPHIAHLYTQYGAAPPYPQYPGPPMHPQMSQQMPQQMPRGRYPNIMPRTQNRMPQPPMPRQRMKRPLQQPPPPQQRPEIVAKQRRMDLLLPDRNEDADCHVIVQQKRNDGVPVIQNVQGATSERSSRSDSTIHLTDSITLSVRQPGSTPAQPQNSGNGPKKPDAKAVANVLAARGITVTPAANKNKIAEQQKLQQQQSQQQQQQQQRNPAPPPPVNVTALNLNSAISIIPASSQRKQQQQQQQQQQQEQSFAVPQNKQSKQSASDVERPPRPPTVDLTQDTPAPALLTPARRGRPPRAMLTCQICDKSFQNQEMLSQHMATHRGTNKLHHKCNLCSAQYPTAQDLALHKQTYHKDHDSLSTNGGIELAIPVIDLKSPQTMSRLSSLGIQSYIPLSQLSAQTGGYFGLPIITIDGPRNSSSCNLGALGATSILSLGPLKHLPNR